VLNKITRRRRRKSIRYNSWTNNDILPTCKSYRSSSVKPWRKAFHIRPVIQETATKEKNPDELLGIAWLSLKIIKYGSVVLLGCHTQQMCISAHKLPLPKIMLQTVSKFKNTVFDVMLDTYQQFGATSCLHDHGRRDRDEENDT